MHMNARGFFPAPAAWIVVLTIGCAASQQKEPATWSSTAAPAGGVAAPAKVDLTSCEPAGKAIAVVHRDSNGSPDRWRYYRPTKQPTRRGHRTFQVLTCELADVNHDGKIDARFFYAADGLLILEQRDLDFDGRPEVVADYSQFRHAGLVASH
jgi:hypothetical protein